LLFVICITENIPTKLMIIFNLKVFLLFLSDIFVSGEPYNERVHQLQALQTFQGQGRQLQKPL
jgi:hypothetical protein